MKNKVVGTAVLSILFCSQFAHANSLCWNNDSIASAKLAEIPNLKNQYLKFNKTNAPHFVEAKKILSEQFQKSSGETDGKLTYDSFVTQVKQSYGTDVSGLQCSDFSELVSDQRSEALTKENIIHLSNMAGALPTVVGKRCANRVSAAKTGTANQVIATH
jgi:hypothetical protein